MKARVRYNNTVDVIGDLTFNKTLNLYKIAMKSGNLYLTDRSLNYAEELSTRKGKSTSRRRKK